MLRYLTDRDVDLFVKLARSAGRKFESASLPHHCIRAAYALATLAHPLKRGVLPFSQNDGLIHTLLKAAQEGAAGTESYCLFTLRSYIDKLTTVPVPMAALPDDNACDTLLREIIKHWQPGTPNI